MATEYDELIKNLRICSRCDFGQDCNGCTQDRDDRFCCDILLHNAADAIEELQGELQALKDDTDMTIVEDGKTTKLCFTKKWIPVTERLPEERTDVLAMTADCDIYVCDFIPSVKQFWTIPGDDLHITDISHWMPLPEPPEEGE